MLKLLRENAERKHLSFGHCFICRRAVGKNAWQLRNFGQPPTVVFTFALEIEFHAVPLARVESIAVEKVTPNV